MYKKILNPITKRKVNIDSKLGKQILRNYLTLLKGGNVYDSSKCINRTGKAECDKKGNVIDNCVWRLNTCVDTPLSGKPNPNKNARNKYSDRQMELLNKNCSLDVITYLNDEKIRLTDKDYQILSPILYILKSTNKETNIAYIKYLWELIAYQHQLNAPIFTSHGLDHSIRTTKYMLDILYGSDEHFYYNLENTTPNTIWYDSLTEIYPKLDLQGIVNSVTWCGLLHDIGYVELELCQLDHVDKNNTGAIKAAIKKRNDWFKRMKPKLCTKDNKTKSCANDSCFDSQLLGVGIENKHTNKSDTSKAYQKSKFIHAYLGENMAKLNIHNLLRQDSKDNILSAIGTHNYDSRGTPTKYSTDIIPGGSLFSLDSGDEIVREYVEADLAKKPLLALLRLADNLDIVKARLSSAQQNSYLMRYMKYHKTYTWKHDKDIKQKHHLDHLDQFWEDLKGDWWKQLVKNEQKAITDIKGVVFAGKNTNGTFDYFYMCWVIEDIKLLSKGNVITIDVNISDLSKEHESLHIKNNWKASILNFTRMDEAIGSISYNNQPIKININFINFPGLERDILIPLEKLVNLEYYFDFINFGLDTSNPQTNHRGNLKSRTQ